MPVISYVDLRKVCCELFLVAPTKGALAFVSNLRLDRDLKGSCVYTALPSINLCRVNP